MKKSSADKFELLCNALESRIEEDPLSFQRLQCTYLSGRQEVHAVYDLVREELCIGTQRTFVTAIEALREMAQSARLYDQALLTFEQGANRLLIEADDRAVRSRSQDKAMEAKGSPALPQASRRYLVAGPSALPLLQEIGIFSKEGKLKNDRIRKYNQIDHFVEVLLPILERLPAKKSLHIVDCACGKSYLSFVLNYYLTEVLKKSCTFTGIDISPDVIADSKSRAKRLGYRNMNFLEADLRVYVPKQPVDLVISLHACDVATDYAIGLGVRSQAASLVLVPCCQHQIKDQLKENPVSGLLSQPLLETRFADWLTDSLRCLYLQAQGYEVTALEYVSPIDTPKNLMIRAFKTSLKDPRAHQRYQQMRDLFGVQPEMETYGYTPSLS